VELKVKRFPQHKLGHRGFNRSRSDAAGVPLVGTLGLALAARPPAHPHVPDHRPGLANVRAHELWHGLDRAFDCPRSGNQLRFKQPQFNTDANPGSRHGTASIRQTGPRDQYTGLVQDFGQRTSSDGSGPFHHRHFPSGRVTAFVADGLVGPPCCHLSEDKAA